MVELQDLLNVGPEETMATVDPMLLQQLISWKRGYTGSGGPFTLLNTDDEPVLLFLENDGLYATPDDGSSGDFGRVLVDDFHSFVGMIVLTDLNPATLADNWATCDGTLGTPDLRDRFVVGVGPSHAAGATGGASTINIAHDHTMAHSHGHAHAGTTLAAPAHTHSGTTLTAAAGHVHGSAFLSAAAGHTHTGPSHTHGPGSLSNSSHGHGAGSLGFSFSLTTGGPSSTSNRADGGNSVGSATHDHNVSTSGGISGSTANGSANVDGGATGSAGTGATAGPTSTTVTGNTDIPDITSVSGSTGGATATALTGSIASDSTGSSAASTGSGGSSSQSIEPPFYALYHAKRVA